MTRAETIAATLAQGATYRVLGDVLDLSPRRRQDAR